MDKVYDVFVDDYISREDMELNAPPERYIEITSAKSMYHLMIRYYKTHKGDI